MRKSILIISNQATVRDMLMGLLADAGYRASLAASGEEAVKIVSSSPFDFVLCELFLADCSGVELKRRILRLSPKSRVKIGRAHV